MLISVPRLLSVFHLSTNVSPTYITTFRVRTIAGAALGYWIIAIFVSIGSYTACPIHCIAALDKI